MTRSTINENEWTCQTRLFIRIWVLKQHLLRLQSLLVPLQIQQIFYQHNNFTTKLSERFGCLGAVTLVIWVLQTCVRLNGTSCLPPVATPTGVCMWLCFWCTRQYKVPAHVCEGLHFQIFISTSLALTYYKEMFYDLVKFSWFIQM